MRCPKISSSRSLCKRLILYPAKNEETYGIVPYQKFFVMLARLPLKIKLQHVGTSGLRTCGLFSGLVGQ